MASTFFVSISSRSATCLSGFHSASAMMNWAISLCLLTSYFDSSSIWTSQVFPMPGSENAIFHGGFF